MENKSDHFTVRQHAVQPAANASPEDIAAYQTDSAIARELGEEMRLSGPYRVIQRRADGRKEMMEQFRQNRHNQTAFLAFKNSQHTGMLVANVSFLLDLDYILAICMFLYVRPSNRDGKSAALLMTAFRQWAEIRQADEMRFLVTSADNIEKTHEMFSGLMKFAHLGGNYAWPLTEKGKQVLGSLQPSAQSDQERH